MDIEEIDKHLKEYNKSRTLICEDCGCLFESNEYQKDSFICICQECENKRYK